MRKILLLTSVVITISMNTFGQKIFLETGVNHGLITKNAIEAEPVLFNPGITGFNVATTINGLERTFEMQPGYYLGVSMGKSVTDKVTLEVGIRYSHYRYNIESTVTGDASEGLSNILIGSLLDRDGNIGSLFGSGNGDLLQGLGSSIIASPEFSASIGYLELPVNVSYELGRKFRVLAGLAPGIKLLTTEVTKYTLDGNTISIKETNGSNFNTVQLSSNLGLTYHLATQWSLQLSHRYYITRINKSELEFGEEETSKEHIHAFSLGMRYTIK